MVSSAVLPSQPEVVVMGNVALENHYGLSDVTLELPLGLSRPGFHHDGLHEDGPHDGGLSPPLSLRCAASRRLIPMPRIQNIQKVQPFSHQLLER
jgi:hypothetical protein